MKLGMNMLLWTTAIGEHHYPVFRDLKDCGFDGVEIPIAPDDDYAAMGRLLDDIGLERTTVFAVDEDANPVSPAAAIRQAAVDALKTAIDKTHALGAHRVVGPFHSAYKTFTGVGPTDDERKWSAEVLHAASEIAAEADVLLCVEPLNRFECYLMNTVADARAVTDMVHHPNCGVLYDTHHMHIEEKNVSDAIARCGSAINHVHVSESDRGTPGSGQVAWAESMRALHDVGYDDWLVIESFSRMDADFAGAIHIWRDFDPSDDVWRIGHEFIRKSWADAEA